MSVAATPPEPTLRVATTAEERAEIYRLRYRIYVQEMGFGRAEADHEREMLVDAHDAGARLVYATVDDRIAGTVRLTLGSDAPMPEDYRAIYQMDRFREVVPLERMSVCSRFLVEPEHRGSMLPFLLMAHAVATNIDTGMELGFCDCEPHLLNLYRSIGLRSYLPPYNDEESLLVPLVMVLSDAEYFDRIGSPLLSFVQFPRDRADIAARINALLSGSDAVRSADDALEASEWASIYAALAGHRRGRVTLFSGLSDEDAQSFLRHGQIIACERGHCLVRRANIARTVFVVLEGTVEVREQDRVVATMSEGDVFGEVAFLLFAPRISDVVAASAHVRVLALSERTLRTLIETESKLAARVLLNLSRALATKLVERSELAALPRA